MSHFLPEGHRFENQIPEGDDQERLVCRDCGFINYINPKIVVGSVPVWEDKILMCRRAIEPRKGFWTLPAGYLEINETTEDGAKREALEEANAELELDNLLAIYNVPRISQVQIMYKARLTRPEFSAGIESLEVALFSWSDIPWDEIAFPTVFWALNHYQEVKDKAVFPPFSNPETENKDLLPGTKP